MARFLEDDTLDFTLPESGSASLAPFTNDNISIPELVFLNVVLFDENFLQIRQIYIEPPHIWISEDPARPPGFFRFVQHLAKPVLSEFAKADTRPRRASVSCSERRIHS